MNETKSVWASKINWTAMVGAVIGVLAAANVIPAEMQERLTEAALIVVGVLIPVLRTWFTTKAIA